MISNASLFISPAEDTEEPISSYLLIPFIWKPFLPFNDDIIQIEMFQHYLIILLLLLKQLQ